MDSFRHTGRSGFTYYPNVMVEWYPHVLVVSTLIPRDVNKTTNVVEFYYPEEIVEFERSSSRPSRPHTWKRPWKMMKSGSGWTVVAGRYSVRAQRDRSLPVADGGRNAAFSRVLSPDHGTASLTKKYGYQAETGRGSLSEYFTVLTNCRLAVQGLSMPCNRGCEQITRTIDGLDYLRMLRILLKPAAQT